MNEIISHYTIEQYKGFLKFWKTIRLINELKTTIQ